MEAFYNVFYVSLLKKYVRNGDNVTSEPPSELREILTIEGRPVRIVGQRVKVDGHK